MVFRTFAFRTLFITITIGTLVFLFVFWRWYEGRTTPRTPVVYAGELAIPVTIADTDASREQGLSDTLSLPQDEGKLFVFETPSRYGFWMKDMHYALDMIWIDSSMHIVDITHDATPESFPEVFRPMTPAQYVLEVNAGFSTVHALTIGEELAFKR